MELIVDVDNHEKLIKRMISGILCYVSIMNGVQKNQLTRQCSQWS